ncbi:MAG TPA: efflux transporter outer membrane subunit [Xanthobacteraceae bacterium]|jgi:NodT family efflux transporter outer membrane factor (OMF) lipoprotein|nr:efflux transporter outer membrane subunit [Xanthobacteraceae bacterium]
MSGVAVRWLIAGTTALAASAPLTSCAVGPDFNRPAAPDIVRYTREPMALQTASTDTRDGQRQIFVSRDISQEWWRLFRSQALNTLIEHALQNNPNLQSALATLRSARENVAAQEGKYFPLVAANFNPTRQRTGRALSPVLSTNSNIFDLDTTQLTVSYTFDVWGLNRRTVEALEALADVQQFQVEAAYLTLTSNLVVAVITEGALRDQIEATVRLIEASGGMRDTLQRQFDAGLVSRNELAAQEAALAQARATLPPLRKALAQQVDLIAALTGVYPSNGPRKTFTLAELRLPSNLPVSLPSLLIEQRPDIRAAEAQLHSASALVGVATANTLPSFTISADGGFVNTALAHLLAPQNIFWDVAGNATQTIFDGGTLWHQLEGTKDTYNAAAWTYRGTVIGAVQNVADSLHALQSDADALRAARDFERASKISFDLASQQLQGGKANVLLSLNAEQSYLQASLQVIQAQAARLSDTAALFAALGGGWWNRKAPPVEKVLDVDSNTADTVVEKQN